MSNSRIHANFINLDIDIRVLRHILVFMHNLNTDIGVLRQIHVIMQTLST